MFRGNNRGHNQGGNRGKRHADDRNGSPPRQRARYEQPPHPPQWNQSAGRDRDYNSSHYNNNNGGQQRNYGRQSHPPAFQHPPAYSHNRNESGSWRNPPLPSQAPFGNARDDSFGCPPPPVPPTFGEVRGTSWRPNGRDFQRHDRQPYGQQQQRSESSSRSSDYSNRSHSHSHSRQQQPQHRGRQWEAAAGEEDGEIVDLVSDEEDEPTGAVDERKAVEERLRRELCLAPNQVPEYVLRMREMGPMAYPPALIDQHVRVNTALPFFGGTVENILPKRRIEADTLPAFRGFTHVRGRRVDPEFVQMMNSLADADYKLSNRDALERSGIEEFREEDDQVLIEKRKSTEVVHFEIPEYEVGESAGYFVAAETKTMNHTLEGFADGIQPFEHSTPNEPTGFMRKLRGLLKKPPAASPAAAAPEQPEAGDALMDVVVIDEE
ncbi:hypothetical protein M3Y99_00483700 [Aphelenchoides fujianensis]|nr:hypothetical protein M3Y99_00483700 [Aphelenchoides fujianensis]